VGEVDAPGSGALAALRAIRADRDSLRCRELAAIRGARALAATWKQIAEALGLDSPQAARQRHKRLERQR